MAVHSQRIGQPPGIEVVGLGAARGFAFTIALRRYRMDRIDGVSPLQELIDRRALAGFNGHGQVRPSRGFFDKLLPAFQRMIEFKVGDDVPFGVDDEQGMVIFSPIEAGVVRDVFPWFHASSFPVLHRGAVMR